MVREGDIPLELLEQIVRLTASARDASALLRTCRTFYRFADHLLYLHRKRRNRALAYAIKHDIEDTFNKVLERPGTKIGLEQVLWTCRYGRLAMLKKMLELPGMTALLEEFSDDRKHVTHYSPLYMASRYGQVEVVKHLLTLPVTGVHRPSGYKGLSPLHGALEGDCEDNPVIPLLLEAAPDLMTQRPRWNGPYDLPMELAVRCCNAGGLRRLLEAGASTNASEEWRSPPLLTTVKAERNAFAMSAALLEHGAAASGVAGLFVKPLSAALQLRRDELVLLLLRHGADLRSGAVRGASALEMALRNCRLDTCKRLVELAGVFPEIEVGRKGLVAAAARSGDVSKLTWILDDPVFQRKGDDKEQLDKEDLTSALVYARSHGAVSLLVSRGADRKALGVAFEDMLDSRAGDAWARADALRGLLDNGANLSGKKDALKERFIDLTRGFKRGSLAPVVGDAGVEMEATEKRQLMLGSVWGYDKNLISMPYIKFLAGWGADINAVNGRGENILFIAMLHNHYRHIDALLDLHADPRVKNDVDNTMLHLIRAAGNGHDVHAASRLLDLGLDPGAANGLGFTPLDTALRHGSPELLALLVRRGGEGVTSVRAVGQGDRQVWASSMHLAVLRHRLSCRTTALETFIRLGVDVNVRDKRQRTPLHWAISVGAAACERLLIRAGADLHARDADGIAAGVVVKGHYADLMSICPSLGREYPTDRD